MSSPRVDRRPTLDAAAYAPLPAAPASTDASAASRASRKQQASQFFFPGRDAAHAPDDGGSTGDGCDTLDSELPSAAAGRRSWVGAVLASVLASLAVGLAIYVLAPRPLRPALLPTPAEEACSVYCHGALLRTVQSARLFGDSKEFVDMPMAADPAETREAFAVAFGDAPPSREALAAFISQFFSAAGSDSVPWVPDDWVRSPAGLAAGMPNASLRGWALGLNALWLQLGRKIIPSVQTFPQRHSLLWQPHGMVVPGGRFRESYYWDTHWIVLGLLHCDMARTARGVVLNLVHLADTYGFVPNGGRAYYVLPGRSQPPMLSSMVRTLWDAMGDPGLLVEAYGALQREYQWFSGSGEYGHAVSVMERAASSPGEASGEGGGGGDNSSHGGGAAPPRRVFILNRYVTDQHIPRPESWWEDVQTAASAGHARDDPAAQILFSEIAAAAESGLDFTARWFADGADIATCATSLVLPVELNAIMHRVERDLAHFGATLAGVAGECGQLAAARAQALRRAAAAAQDAPTAVAIELQPDGSMAAARSSGAHGPTVPHPPPHDPPVPAPSRCSELCAALLARHGNASAAAASADALPLLYAGLAARLRAESVRYAEAGDDRAEAMEALMWDEAGGRWRDLHVAPEALAHTEPVGAPPPPRYVTHRAGVPIGRAVSSRFRPRTDLQLGRNVGWGSVVSATDWLPLWSGSHCWACSPDALAARTRRVAASLAASGLLQPGGLASTLAHTHEQWDGSNGWAPLNHMMALGLDAAGSAAAVPEAQALGREIARRWLRSGLMGFGQAGVMYEKMNMRMPGQGGGGGEYVPQVGFGWSNGAALDLLKRFAWAHLEAAESEEPVG